MGASEEEAWVTLATNDTYALGALVLAHSIRRVGTSRRLVALVTPGVTMAMRDQLSATFDLVELVNVLDSGDSANLALLSRPDLGVTFTKLHCWRLTQFSKCVFLDADTLILHPCDELFDREELSAAPDAGWPDCFNSGVYVFKPSNETYNRLIEFAVSHGSFDGGDQGLLNSFFSDWATKDISRHLPFIYNMCSTATYSYLPAYKKFGETVRIAHFIGASKPWMQPFDSETRQVKVGPGQEHQRMLLQIWWDIFCLHVHPHLSIDMRHRTSLVPQLENSTPAHFIHNLFENFDPNSFEPHPSHFDEEWWVQSNEPSSNPPTEPIACLPKLPRDDCEERWPQSNEPSSNPPTEPIACLPNLPRDDCEERWPQSNEPSSNPPTEPIACLPNLPRDDPPENLPCNDQPGEAATDPSGGNSEPPCMEVSLEPQTPLIPPAQPPSPQQSSVCLRSPPVTVGMVEEQAEREVSLHSMENEGVPLCADPSPETEGGLAAAFSQMTLGAPKTEQQMALEEHLRREAWELGQIDYLGQDSFDNVWKRIMQTLSLGPASSSSQPPPSEPPPQQSAPTPPSSQPPPPPPPQPTTPPPPPPQPTTPPPPPPQPTPPPPQPTPPPSQPTPPPSQPTPPSPQPTPTPPQPTPSSPQPSSPSPKSTPPLLFKSTAPPPKSTAPPPKSTAPPPKSSAPPPKSTPPPPKPTPPPPKPTPPTPVAPVSPAGAASTLPQKKPETPSQKESKVATAAMPEPSSPSQPAAPQPAPAKPTMPSSPPPGAPAKVVSSGAAKVVPPEQKESGTGSITTTAAAAAKQVPPKASPAPAQEEAAARGQAPVAPKRKGGASTQQQGASGRGKSGGQKGKK